MHNNYYLFRQLSQRLEPIVAGSVISECFSQQKDELIVRTETADGSYYIRATVRPDFSCLSFPREFARARKNSIDLFPKIAGRKIRSVLQYDNERSFELILSDGYSLLFKMHGNRSNVLGLHDGLVIDMFRKNITSDATLKPETLHRIIDWSYEAFISRQDNLSAHYFTFGKPVWKFLESNGFSHQPPEVRWQSIHQVLQLLRTPTYYLTFVDHKPVLSLVKIGTVEKVMTDPIGALNEFYSWYTHHHAVSRLKTDLLRQLRNRLESSHSYVVKNEAKLQELDHSQNYKQLADLIMANLHAIPAGADRVVVDNFYDNNTPIEIRLKGEQSAQDNAGALYRKAKNQKIERERIGAAVRGRREEMEALKKQITAVETADDVNALRKIRGLVSSAMPDKTESASSPYHEFVFRGFRIWVGKNAQANDVLTLKFARKDDLWLHARDVAGSHVIIKQQPGKNFPAEVVEYAAGLAAYNSRRRTETLCPVIVTPRKFVRKRKGDPPGAVVVEREEVIMVTPVMPS